MALLSPARDTATARLDRIEAQLVVLADAVAALAEEVRAFREEVGR